MRDIRISDTTMKAAKDAKSIELSFKEKLELSKLLNRLSVSVVEIEGIEKPKVDSLRIKSIASIVTDAVLAVPVKLDGEDVDQIWECLAEAKHPRLQVMASVSPAQMEYIYHKKAPAMLDSIEQTVAAAAALCPDVEFIAEDATRADQDYLGEAIARAIKAGATTVTIFDEAGNMLPEEFGAFVDDLVKFVPELNDISLGIACSDALYMANACATAGIMAGVDEIKASMYPLGITSVEKMAKIITDKRDQLGVTTGVRTTEIKRVSEQIRRICESGDAQGPSIASTSEVDGSIQLDVNDTIETVTACAAKLGYELSAEDQVNVYEAFRRIAEKKDVVGSRELDTIVATAALQVPATYEIVDYVFNSGNHIRSTARVHLKKDDEDLEYVGMGDGPIDAAFAAVEHLVGQHFELDDFQIQSVTEGHEAMGHTLVKLAANGKLYSGRGISTDIVGAAIRAFVSAVNKIVYEEQN